MYACHESCLRRLRAKHTSGSALTLGKNMNPKHREVLRKISISGFPLAITPPEEDLQSFLYLADGYYIDAEIRNRKDLLVRSVTPAGWDALEKKTDQKPRDGWHHKIIPGIVIGIVLLIVGAAFRYYFPQFFPK